MGLFDFLKNVGVESANPGVRMPRPVPSRYVTKYGVQIPFVDYQNPPDLSDLAPKLVRIDTNTYLPILPFTNDNFVAVYHAAKIPILMTTPYVYEQTAGDVLTSLPPQFKSPGAVATYMRDLAVKYAGRVASWEIMNEPNAPVGSNGNSRFYTPRDYMTFLVPISAAIRSGDPLARIVSGGTSGMALAWHKELAALGAGEHIDDVAFHPYGETPSTVVDAILSLQAIWPTKNLICSEFGDRDPAVAVAMHAAMSGFVSASVFFTYSGDDYGLFDAKGTRRSSYDGMKPLFARSGAA